MHKWKSGMWTGLIALVCSLSVLADPLPFDSHSMQQIEQQHAGKPFLVVMWATDCAPCRRELTLLAEFTRVHPQVPVILIASDSFDQAQVAQAILSDYTLGGVESWLFADANVERLRYAVDPDWFGEIPRSYFYDQAGHRVGVSGALTAGMLDDWYVAHTEMGPDTLNADNSDMQK